MAKQHQETWEIYTSAWKAIKEEDKRALFDKSLATNCIYRDPLIVADGWEALLSYMLDFHKTIPGGYFVTREFKSHNNRSISEWDMRACDGTVIGVGISYAEYNRDGKLTSMTGFFDSNEE